MFRPVALLLAAAASSVEGQTWPTIQFDPPMQTPDRSDYIDGMDAWLDIPGSKYVDIPDWLKGGTHKAWLTKELLKDGTTVTISCPDPHDDGMCDVYVYVYHCPPCALHGGLPAALLSSGWVSGSCAPFFIQHLGSRTHKMSIFRRQLAKGESVSFTTTMDGRYVGFGASPYGVRCSDFSTQFECSSQQHCRFEKGSCVDNWCPKRFIYSPPPPLCTVCVDQQYPDFTPRPSTLAPSTPKPYAPTPKPYAPTPKPYAPTPKPYAPTPKPYAPTPKPYVSTPKPDEYITKTVEEPVNVCGNDMSYRPKNKATPAMFINQRYLSVPVATYGPSFRSFTDWSQVGIRWQITDLPADAEILDAEVRMIARYTGSGEVDFAYALEDSDDSKEWAQVQFSSRKTLKRTVVKQKITISEFTMSVTENMQELAKTPREGKHISLIMERVSKKSTGFVMFAACELAQYIYKDYNRGVKYPLPTLKYTYRIKTTTTPGGPPPSPPNPIQQRHPETSTDKCPNRVRQAYSRLPCEERERLARAIKTLHDRKPDVFNGFVEMHLRATSYAHGTSAFLPFHRWFLVMFENALRDLGTEFECVTLAYWDWETERNSQFNAGPLKHKTFGELGTTGVEQCINSGIAVGWNTYQRGRVPPTCVKRKPTGNVLIGEGEINTIFMKTTYKGFSDALAPAPHAAIHNYVGGHMSTMWSPIDPLFWLHHANVDRYWALWQDFRGHDLVHRSSLTTEQYSAWVDTSNNNPTPLNKVQIDSQLPLDAGKFADALKPYVSTVTIRDVHSITDLPDGVRYVYGTDCLASQITRDWTHLPGGNVFHWVTAACPLRGQDPLTCCGDGTAEGDEQCDDGNTDSGDGCGTTCQRETTARHVSVLEDDSPDTETVPEQCSLPNGCGDNTAYTGSPVYQDAAVQQKHDELVKIMDSVTEREYFCTLANVECNSHQGDTRVASDAWIEMNGQTNNTKMYDSCGFYADDCEGVREL